MADHDKMIHLSNIRLNESGVPAVGDCIQQNETIRGIQVIGLERTKGVAHRKTRENSRLENIYMWKHHDQIRDLAIDK